MQKEITLNNDILKLGQKITQDDMLRKNTNKAKLEFANRVLKLIR